MANPRLRLRRCCGRLRELDMNVGAEQDGMVRAASRVFFAVLFLAFAGPAVYAGNRVALVIGNSDYALAPLEIPKTTPTT